jgi:hypothetical protein
LMSQPFRSIVGTILFQGARILPRAP